MSGLELLPKAKAVRPDVPIIMITAYGTAVPLVAALVASLIHPPLWRKFHAGAVGPYAVTPEAWDKILAAAE